MIFIEDRNGALGRKIRAVVGINRCHKREPLLAHHSLHVVGKDPTPFALNFLDQGPVQLLLTS